MTAPLDGKCGLCHQIHPPVSECSNPLFVEKCGCTPVSWTFEHVCTPEHKPLSVEVRAKYIVDKLCGERFADGDSWSFVTRQLREACEEAVREDREKHNNHVEDVVKEIKDKAFAQGVEAGRKFCCCKNEDNPPKVCECFEAAREKVLELLKDGSCDTWQNGAMGGLELDEIKLVARIREMKP